MNATRSRTASRRRPEVPAEDEETRVSSAALIGTCGPRERYEVDDGVREEDEAEADDREEGHALALPAAPVHPEEEPVHGEREEGPDELRVAEAVPEPRSPRSVRATRETTSDESPIETAVRFIRPIASRAGRREKSRPVRRAADLPVLDQIEERQDEGEGEGRVAEDRERHVEGEERSLRLRGAAPTAARAATVRGARRGSRTGSGRGRSSARGAGAEQRGTRRRASSRRGTSEPAERAVRHGMSARAATWRSANCSDEPRGERRPEPRRGTPLADAARADREGLRARRREERRASRGNGQSMAGRQSIRVAGPIPARSGRSPGYRPPLFAASAPSCWPRSGSLISTSSPSSSAALVERLVPGDPVVLAVDREAPMPRSPAFSTLPHLREAVALDRNGDRSS